jgi:hypothetical protein
MPIDERQRLREEIRCHLDRFAATYESEGLPKRDAALRAIDEFGRSDQVGDDFALAWMSRRVKGRLAKLVGWQNAVAITCFGAATAWVSVLEQLHIFMLGQEASPAPITFGLSPAELRLYIPRPFPLPENSPTFWLLIVSLVVAPLIAGAIAGWFAPIRSTRAAYQALMGFTIYSFVTGVLMLPACYGLFVALFQLFYWMPLGCLSVYLGAAARRRQACRFAVLS